MTEPSVLFDEAAFRRDLDAVAKVAARSCGQSDTVFFDRLRQMTGGLIARQYPHVETDARRVAEAEGCLYTPPPPGAGECRHGIMRDACPAGCGDMDGSLLDIADEA